MLEIATLPNVVCKISGLVTLQSWAITDIGAIVDVALDCFGSERLLFGSDWPVSSIAASYRDVADHTRSWIEHLSHAEKFSIMRSNAITTYNLDLVGFESPKEWL